MSAYYNEWEPNAAAWLRELIRMGLIADGEVDTRSILDVSADDLRGFTQCHFFAGIGGWSYALQLAGIPNDAPLWTGSPPCQPWSAAGQQKGKDDVRHLSPHFAKLIGECRPPMLFGEQVASAAVFGKAAKPSERDTGKPSEWVWIDDLCDRLEAAHYAVGACDLPAAGVDAPHIRQRTFFGAARLADSNDSGPQGWIRRWAHQGWEDFDGYTGCGGSTERMADSDSSGLVAAPIDGILDSQHNAESCRDLVRMGDTDCQLSGWRSEQAFGAQTGCGCIEGTHDNRPVDSGKSLGKWSRQIDNPWRDVDWIFCRDGKWRPTESSLLGLADGIPADLVRSGAFVPASQPLAPKSKESRRPMRLKGYGNAIVPRAAATFIRAFIDSID